MVTSCRGNKKSPRDNLRDWEFWHAHGESNPGYRREKGDVLTARRWAHIVFSYWRTRSDSNARPCWFVAVILYPTELRVHCKERFEFWGNHRILSIVLLDEMP